MAAAFESPMSSLAPLRGLVVIDEALRCPQIFPVLRTLIEMTEVQRKEMGMRGRKLVEEKFTWPKVAAQMKEIFDDLV